jgi:hypothetical protein
LHARHDQHPAFVWELARCPLIRGSFCKGSQSGKFVGIKDFSQRSLASRGRFEQQMLDLSIGEKLSAALPFELAERGTTG